MCGGFVGDVLDAVTGGLLGNDRDDKVIQAPAPPTITVEQEKLEPEKLNLSQENSAQSQLDAMAERNRRRGQSSTIHTGGTGVSTSSVGKKNLLGS